MSGRARHLRDGEWITNRKTDRRNPRRTPADRRLAILRAALKAPGDEIQVGLCFRLPESIAPFTASGQHGIGVAVTKTGHMVVVGKSSEHCLYLVRSFMRDIAREKPAFCAGVTVIGNEAIETAYDRHLLVIAGVPALCNGNDPPKWCEAA